jgi:hypothetical protein
MGYRSDVYSCIYGDADEIIALMTRDKLCNDEVFTHFADDIKVDELRKGEKIIILELEYTKWYPDYEEVQAWDKFLDEADVRGLEWEFVAIGEDNEIESRQSNGSVGFISVTCNASIDY